MNPSPIFLCRSSGILRVRLIYRGGVLKLTVLEDRFWCSYIKEEGNLWLIGMPALL